MASQDEDARGPSYDDDSWRTALAEELTSPGPAERIDALVAQQEAARPESQELSPAAQRSRAAFEADGQAVGELMSAEIETLNAKWDRRPVYDEVFASDSSLRHVFGPDVDGTGAPQFYRDRFVHLDGGSAGAGIDARADHRTGKFSASHYTINGWLNGFAYVAAFLTPQVPRCRLSVRPYIPWSGYDTLYHGVHQPGTTERRWAVATATMGIILQSRGPGETPVTEREHWAPPLWNRSELNPSGSRTYEGTGIPSTGVALEHPVATNQREYAFWVGCKIAVWADRGFQVSTRAGGTVSCSMPFLVVEEIPF
jgi:hypothetical protein